MKKKPAKRHPIDRYKSQFDDYVTSRIIRAQQDLTEMRQYAPRLGSVESSVVAINRAAKEAAQLAGDARRRVAAIEKHLGQMMNEGDHRHAIDSLQAQIKALQTQIEYVHAGRVIRKIRRDQLADLVRGEIPLMGERTRERAELFANYMSKVLRHFNVEVIP